MAPRTSIAAKLADANVNLQGVDADTLFSIVDKDGSGTVSKDEFKRLHLHIVEQVTNDMVEKQKAKDAMHSAARKNKVLFGVTILLLIFLGVSVAANAGITYVLVDGLNPLLGGKVGPNGNGLASKSAPGQFAEVKASTTNYALRGLRYLPSHILEGVNKLRLHRATTPGFAGESKSLETMYTITGYDRTDPAKGEEKKGADIVLFTARGDSIHVNDANAFVRISGSDYAICDSDVSCAAISLTDFEEADGEIRKVLSQAEIDAMKTNPSRRMLSVASNRRRAESLACQMNWPNAKGCKR